MNNTPLNAQQSSAPIVGGKPRPELQMMNFVEMHLEAIKAILPVFGITLVVSDPENRANSFVAIGDDLEAVIQVLQASLAKQRASAAGDQLTGG